MHRVDARDDRSRHRCRGVSCPHVVNTGEALVCALTGVCVGDVVMASYDFVSASSLCREKKTTTTDDEDRRRETGVLVAVDEGTDGTDGTEIDDPAEVGDLGSDEGRRNDELTTAETKETTRPARPARPARPTRSFGDLADAKNEKLYGECYRVVETLFGECEGASSAWKDALALRCRECHALCVSSLGHAAASKIKSDYACLAALYLMREGLVIKGTRVCEVDERVAANIPSLNAMTKFGFQKSKYTRAYRTLMEAIDKAQYAVPLHELKI